jgi:aerobic-type carbon monoxide dehydrogenase small subunit (CoxS/CutS family)
MAAIEFSLNGQARKIDTDPDRSLLHVLREDFDLTAAKYGCGEGQCGACTVLLDGRPVNACVTRVQQAHGRSITTLEGLAAGGRLHAVQQAFLDRGAMQCGFCTSGMILSAVALLADKPKPTRAEIVAAMNGNLCRCCVYPRILEAVQRAAK